MNCNGSLSKYPKEELVLQIVFQTDPAKTEKLSAVVVEQLNKMAKEGPSAEHMQKIKEYMLKKYKDYYNGIHAGSFWFHGCIPISFLDIQISLLVSCFLNLICCLHVS